MQLLKEDRLLEIATLNGGSVLSSESQMMAREILSLRELALKLATGVVNLRDHIAPESTTACPAYQWTAGILKEVFEQYPAFKTKSGAY
jgi:hypothetical protein